MRIREQGYMYIQYWKYSTPLFVSIFIISCVGPSSSSSSSSVVVVVVVEGSRQCAFWVVEIFLSTPNKICAFWVKYLVFVHLVFVKFCCCTYSTTAVCVHFHFWQKIKSKTKKLFFVVVPLHYCCCAYTRLGRTDGQTDGQLIRPGSQ